MSTSTEQPDAQEQRELAELKARMGEKLGRLNPAEREGIDATLSYGVRLTRSEYRTLARQNWHSIRRWGRRTSALLVVMLLAWLALGGASLDNSATSKTLAKSNCRNVEALASIERRFIVQQQQQTAALLRSGFTFGIPKDRLPALLAASEANQQAFLAAFDALASSNCR